MGEQADSIVVAYRDVDRTPLLYVLAQLAAEHEGLDVELRRVSDGAAYEEGFLSGELDVICEHLRFLFPARRDGHPVRMIASMQNESTERLLVLPEVRELSDLARKAVIVRATPSSKMSARSWLVQLGLGDNEVREVDDGEVGRWQQWKKVVAGEGAAVVCSLLHLEEPLAAGLRVLDVAALAELGPLFLAVLGPFAAAHDGELRKLLRALYRALFVFRHQPEMASEIVADEPARLIGLDTAGGRRLFEQLRFSYTERPFPTLEAIATTSAIVDSAYAPLAGLNPLALWDLHYLLELEEQGIFAEVRGTGVGR